MRISSVALLYKEWKESIISDVTSSGVEREYHQWRYNFRSGKRVSSVTLLYQEWKEIIISEVTTSGVEREYHQWRYYIRSGKRVIISNVTTSGV